VTVANISSGVATGSSVNLVAGGAIDQTGPAGFIIDPTAVGAITTDALTVKTLNDAGAAISLASTANSANSVNLMSRNAADTANAGGAITYLDSTGVAIAGLGTTSTATITTSGAITSSGV